MAEALIIPTSGPTNERYRMLLPQLEALICGENDLIANLANITSTLKYGMEFFWVGFYLVKDDELVLGPFQGPVACTRIFKGKGVCGNAWVEKETIIVPDVTKYPGHIVCNATSKSEIVIPVIREGEVVMVLDIDSDKLDAFGEQDQKYLERVTRMIK